MSGASRLRSLMPVPGLLMAAALLLLLRPSVIMPLVLGGLALCLGMLWLLQPAAYARVHALLEGALRALSVLVTFPVLVAAYFLLLTPIALLMRCMGRDLLARHQPASSSEWRQPQPRSHDEEFFRVQF